MAPLFSWLYAMHSINFPRQENWDFYFLVWSATHQDRSFKTPGFGRPARAKADWTLTSFPGLRSWLSLCVLPLGLSWSSHPAGHIGRCSYIIHQLPMSFSWGWLFRGAYAEKRALGGILASLKPAACASQCLFCDCVWSTYDTEHLLDTQGTRAPLCCLYAFRWQRLAEKQYVLELLSREAGGP